MPPIAQDPPPPRIRGWSRSMPTPIRTPTRRRSSTACATPRTAACRARSRAGNLASAGVVVGAFYDSLTFCATAIDSARAEGRLGVLPRLLARQAILAVRLPNWDIAIPAAEEARRLATELGQPHLARHRRNGDRDDRGRPRRPGGDGARDGPCRADRAAARRHPPRRACPVRADLVGAGARSP